MLGSKFFSGPVKFVLSGSGHIAGVVNPPTRRNINIGPAPGRQAIDIAKWLAEAQEHPGSWWPDWLDWLKAQDAEPRYPRASRAAACSRQSRTRRDAM